MTESVDMQTRQRRPLNPETPVNIQQDDDEDNETGSGNSCCPRRSVVTVLSCSVIFYNFTLVNNWVTTNNLALNYTADWGETGDRQIRRAYSGISSIITIFAALLSMKVGYRVVAVIGCLLMMSGLFVASWLNSDNLWITGILVGGVAGVGASFVKLAATVPVLENVRQYRFVAVVFVYACGVCADVLHYGLSALDWLTDSVDLNWKTLYQWQVVVMTFALLASLNLEPSNDRWTRTYFSPFDWSVFQQRTLYILMSIVLCNRFGQYILSKEIFTFFDKTDNSATPYLGGFVYYGGQVFGPMLLFSCVSVRKEVVPMLMWIAPIEVIAGGWTIFIASSKDVLQIAMYACVLGVAKAAVTTLIQNVIPSVFGLKNVRLVGGLLDFAAGVGVLLSSPVQALVQQSYDEDDQYASAFCLSGSALVLAAALVFVCVRVVSTELLILQTSIVTDHLPPDTAMHHKA